MTTQPKVRLAVLGVLLGIHVLHVLGVTNRFPFHSLDMFRRGQPQTERPSTISVSTPILLEPGSCQGELLPIRREHGIQFGKRYASPAFLLRWDNTATFPLRYDADERTQLKTVVSVVPTVEGTILTMAEVSHDYTSHQRWVIPVDNDDVMGSTDPDARCDRIEIVEGLADE